MDPLVGILIYVLIVIVLVFAALYIAARTLPPDMQWIAKLVIGILGLIAILYKLVPLAGVH